MAQLAVSLWDHEFRKDHQRFSKVAYNYEERKERELFIMTSALDTETVWAMCRSRIGMKRPAVAIDDTTDIFGFIRDLPEKPTVFLVDEAQFLKRHMMMILRLARVVDMRHTYCYGLWFLKNDFRNELFEGSKHLLLLE